MEQTENVESTSNLIAGSNIVINATLAGSLAILWSLVNALQIVAYMGLLGVLYPNNAMTYYDMAYFLATLKVLPAEDIRTWFEETVLEALAPEPEPEGKYGNLFWRLLTAEDKSQVEELVD